MDQTAVMEVARDALTTLLIVAGPVMGIALGVGLTIALFQALTQIQEMTLTFVPKIVVIFVALMVLFPFIGSTLSSFMARIADRIAGG
ncbi:MAG: flagellar biosynthesis protein FliQ [Sphingomonadales bacterium]|nr:flagellar biosynthesis protein FliQ [Sphingomonadales bacterium]